MSPLRVPLRFVNGLPVVAATIGTETVDVMVDLGGAGGISVARTIATRYGRPTGRFKRLRDVQGTPLIAREFEVDAVAVGDLVLRQIRIHEAVFDPAFAPPVQTGSIGQGILGAYVLVFDYPAAELVLSRSQVAVPPRPGRRWNVIRFSSTRYGAVIPVLMAGQRLHLLIDTGATSSFLIPARVADKSHDGKHVRTLEIGGHPEVVEFAVFDIALPGVDGFLGADFFATRRVMIDLTAGECAIEVVA